MSLVLDRYEGDDEKVRLVFAEKDWEVNQSFTWDDFQELVKGLGNQIGDLPNDSVRVGNPDDVAARDLSALIDCIAARIERKELPFP